MILPAGVACVLIWLLFGDYTAVVEGEGVLFRLPDDQMITQRVAYNFHHHAVPYLNPEESVAAATSLFWPILLSSLYTVADYERAVALTLVLSLVISAAAVCVAAMQQQDKAAAYLCVFGLAAAPGLLRYASSGWEHVPQMLCVTVATGIFLGANRDVAQERLYFPTATLGWLWISFLFRPDSAPLVAVFGIFWLADGVRRAPRQTAHAAMLLALMPAAYLGLMLYYFGDVVPNTAYLKALGFEAQFANGVVYFLTPSKSGIVPTLLAALWLVWPLLREAEKVVVLLLTAQLGFVVSVGGDFFESGRFFLLVLPTAVAVASAVLVRLVSRTSRSAAIRMAILGAFCLPIPAFSAAAGQGKLPGFAQPQGFRPNDQLAHMALAARLQGVLRPDDGSIALFFLGCSYDFARFHVVDLLGKADPVVARGPVRTGPVGHNKWDFDHSFGAYDIAAVPIFHPFVVAWQIGAPRADAPPEVELLERLMRDGSGYGYIEPARLGMPDALPYGVFLRSDVAERVAAWPEGRREPSAASSK